MANIANFTADQLLKSETINDVVSLYESPGSVFTDIFRAGKGGGLCEQRPGDTVGWDLFNRNRDVATIRPTGMGPATVSQNRIGHVSSKTIRAHEKMPILLSDIYRTRPLGKPWGTVDTNGRSHITAQEQHMADRFINLREFALSRMCRGSFHIRIDGDEVVPVDMTTAGAAPTGSVHEVNFRIPTNNKKIAASWAAGFTPRYIDNDGTEISGNAGLIFGAGVNVLDVTWATIASAKVFTHVDQIRKTMAIQSGKTLKYIITTSSVMNNVLQNAQLATIAGSVNQVFTQFELVQDSRTNRKHVIYKLRAIPYVTWIVIDDVINVDGTLTPFLPDGYIIAMPEPDSDWFSMLEGSYQVQENIAASPYEAYGMSFWSEPKTQPPQFELLGEDSFLPALKIPSCIYYLRVQ